MKLHPAPLIAPDVSPERKAAFDKIATSLEASFLAEMLKSAGVGKSRESFGGGAGEDVFSSLLVQKQAELMTQKDGIGLAHSIVQSLINEAKND